jgi:hypothetical protein
MKSMMQMHKIENKLYCLFKVSNSLLHVSYELNVKEGTIRYEISSYTEKEPLKTGLGKEATSLVDSYQLMSVQSALLKREDASPKGSSKK